jgi:hypothetical protein
VEAVSGSFKTRDPHSADRRGITILVGIVDPGTIPRALASSSPFSGDLAIVYQWYRANRGSTFEPGE